MTVRSRRVGSTSCGTRASEKKSTARSSSGSIVVVACFGIALRVVKQHVTWGADSYGRVQRRVNGIHELPRSGSLHEHLGENLQSIETQTQSEDLQLQQLQEQNEQALEDMAQADLAYLDMVLHKAGMHPTAGARNAANRDARNLKRGGNGSR